MSSSTGKRTTAGTSTRNLPPSSARTLIGRVNQNAVVPTAGSFWSTMTDSAVKPATSSAASAKYPDSAVFVPCGCGGWRTATSTST
jgi:hypothetical protein